MSRPPEKLYWKDALRQIQRAEATETAQAQARWRLALARLGRYDGLMRSRWRIAADKTTDHEQAMRARWQAAARQAPPPPPGGRWAWTALLGLSFLITLAAVHVYRRAALLARLPR